MDVNGGTGEWMDGTNLCVMCITRGGAVHAAGEGRHLHGGHCLVSVCSSQLSICTQVVIFSLYSLSLVMLLFHWKLLHVLFLCVCL